jgi:FSR family fosmidomycin resistance protein-like MFS transporter
MALSASHFVNDAFAGIYAPLLPMFIPGLGLSLAQAGAIAMATQVANSAGQVAFGLLADRGRAAMLAIAGPFLAIAVLSLAGIATSPTMLGAIMVVGSLGSAAFHPSSASLVHRAGGRAPGLAMSVHVTGGAVGGAFGPLLFAPYVQHFGLQWTPLLAVPGLLAVGWIQRAIPRDAPLTGIARAGLASLRPYARPLTLLWSAVVVRSVVALAFTTFLPVLLTRRGYSVGAAGAVMGLYLLAGSVGGLGGGPVADRFGARRVMVWTLFLSVPLQLAAVWLDGTASLVALMAGGFFLGSTLPVNVTYAHMIAPVATGIVSSLMLGVAWGAAGLAVPLVGLAADALGLPRALQWVAWLPAVAAALTLLLPADSPDAHGVTVTESVP